MKAEFIALASVLSLGLGLLLIGAALPAGFKQRSHDRGAMAVAGLTAAGGLVAVAGLMGCLHWLAV